MKAKKIITTFLVTTIVASQISFIPSIQHTKATEDLINNENSLKIQDGHYKYFYSQLTDQSKKIYDAMCYMYNEGLLKSGNTNYDLVANGQVTEDTVKSYIQGNNDLIIAFETARDAFYLDYPDLFYINMEKFSIRITNDKANKYHVWLGSGNNDSYYLQGFSSVDEVNNAETVYKDKVNQIVNEAKAIEVAESENLTEKQIEYVHKVIIKTTTYKLDDVCKPENAGNIRTPYGTLIAGESVCEGYSKAMKVILDKLDIPCILIRGVYQHGTSNYEAHMWNYVQINGNWYAIDATFDDNDSNEDAINVQYFLVGSNTMSKHYTNGIMSAPEFEFKYPEIGYDNYRAKEVYCNDGLSVKYETTTDSGLVGGRFRISYKGMGMQKAKEQGYYFVSRYYQKNTSTGDITVGKWSYLFDDDEYFYGMIEDSDKEFYIDLWSMLYAEFAVTDIPQGPYNDKKLSDLERLKYLNYLGDTGDFVAYSGVLENPDGTYLPAPDFVSASPYIETKLKPGKKTHIKITYAEKLIVQEGIGPSMYFTCNAATSSGETNSKLENFTYNDYSIEFDFTPSTMWGDNSVVYYFHVNGLVGEYSKKAPRPGYYYVQESLGCTYSMRTSGVWRAYARPTLIENEDLSITGWTTSDGKPVSEKLQNRVALVTTKTTTDQANVMNNLIKNEIGDNVIKSETYNINLTVCNKTVITNGAKLTVYLGFPEGYGPNDEGVSFKAYHFITKCGETVGIEEIPCVVTKYGLLITCKSFSPFAIVAVSVAEEPQNVSKSVVLTSAEGGKIIGSDNSIVTLNEGETKTYTIKADDGYKIDSLSVLGSSKVEAIGKDSFEFTIGYDDIKSIEDNIVNATFVSNKIIEEELLKGEKVVNQNTTTNTETENPTKNFEINMNADKEYIGIGDTFEVTVKLNNFKNMNEGIIAIAGRIKYDTSILELIPDDSKNSLTGLNGWNFGAYNEDNFKFVADNGVFIKEDNTEIFKVKFKLKDFSDAEDETTISVIDVEASDAEQIIYAVNNANVTMKFGEEITSEKYKIEDTIISRIPPKTTVADFKNNVTTKQDINFTSADGVVLKDSDFVTTNTKIKVGKTLNYTLCVIGDTDGDGEITVTDLAQVKLHYIGSRVLEGISLKAADTDGDDENTITDIAQIKLVIIEKLSIK